MVSFLLPQQEGLNVVATGGVFLSLAGTKDFAGGIGFEGPRLARGSDLEGDGETVGAALFVDQAELGAARLRARRGGRLSGTSGVPHID